MALQAPEPLAAGARVGDAYEILRPIAQGPAGTLWEAQDLKEPRKVALLVPAGGPADAAALERARQAAQAVGKANHPGVAQVLAVDSLPSGTPVFVLEALAGEPLSARLAQGALPMDLALKLGRDIASALAAAHFDRLVHGRLSADLVFPGPSGADPAKVAGFGLAEVQPAAAAAQGCLAPEQLAPGGAVDARADEYALAALLYQMLSGQPLAQGGAEAALAALKGLPRRVVSALRRALEPDREKRYPDAVYFMSECSGRGVAPGDGRIVKFVDLEVEATILKPKAEPAAAPPAPASAPAAAAAPAAAPKRRAAIAVALAVALAAIVGLGWLALR